MKPIQRTTAIPRRYTRGWRFCATLWLALLAPNAWPQGEGAHCPPQPAAPSPARLQALLESAQDRGFLWKIGKPGRSGYLYGTIHVGREEWLFPGPRTMVALNASDVVALELDVLDPSLQAQMADPVRFGIKPLALPPPLQRRIEAVARSVCAPLAELAAQHPMMQWITLTLLDARFSALEAGYGNEVFLAGFARAEKKPVASLESAELQLRVLMAGEPGELIELLDRNLALLESKKARTVMQRMISAWAAGDLAVLEDYPRWCECVSSAAERKALQKLNDERNPGLADAIDRLMAGGKTVFAAVGALHMAGARGLPRLLQAKGYTVERVRFDR